MKAIVGIAPPVCWDVTCFGPSAQWLHSTSTGRPAMDVGGESSGLESDRPGDKARKGGRCSDPRRGDRDGPLWDPEGLAALQPPAEAHVPTARPLDERAPDRRRQPVADQPMPEPV